MADNRNVVQKVRALISPIIANLSLSLWDVEFVKDGSAWILRIYIDNDGGVTIDDCEKVSRAIDKLLDEKDFIAQSYYLEVSSPGIERMLNEKEHFFKYIGSDINVKLYSPVNGSKNYIGKLLKYEDGAVTIDTGSEILTFNKETYAKINLYVKF